MVKVKRYKHLLHRCHRLTQLDIALAEAIQRGAAYLHHAVELDGRISAVGPLVDAWIGAHVLVGHVAQVLFPSLGQDYL